MPGTGQPEFERRCTGAGGAGANFQRRRVVELDDVRRVDQLRRLAAHRACAELELAVAVTLSRQTQDGTHVGWKCRSARAEATAAIGVESGCRSCRYAQ